MKLPADISRCANDTCPSATICARFTDTNTHERTPYNDFKPYGDKCDSFISNKPEPPSVEAIHASWNL